MNKTIKLGKKCSKKLKMLNKAIFKNKNGLYYVLYENKAYSALSFNKLLEEA